MTSETKQVLVIGGGFAGVMAAVRLAGKMKRQPVRVTLINSLDYFVERPRLHEAATGTDIGRKPIVAMLHGTGANFVQGWITALDPNQQTVTLDNGQTIAYDYLVYALGSSTERRSVAGVAEHAFALDSFGQLSATALKTALAARAATAERALVIGGGATGVETAAQLKAAYPSLRVSLITEDKVGAFQGEAVRRHITAALREQGVETYEDCAVVQVAADHVTLAGERQIAADFTIWAAGFVPPPLARQAGLKVNERGQILVDPMLRSLSHPNIYGVGDAAWTVEEPGAPLRMAVLPALTMGAQAADNIIRHLKGKTQRPFSFVWYGQGIALGPYDAIGFGTYPVDTVRGPIMRGKAGVNIRRFALWLIKFTLEMERRYPGCFTWNGRRRYAQGKRQNNLSEAVLS